jgi:hypothetical protein
MVLTHVTKTLLTMQFGNQTLFLFVDTLNTVRSTYVQFNAQRWTQ